MESRQICLTFSIQRIYLAQILGAMLGVGLLGDVQRPIMKLEKIKELCCTFGTSPAIRNFKLNFLSECSRTRLDLGNSTITGAVKLWADDSSYSMEMGFASRYSDRFFVGDWTFL